MTLGPNEALIGTVGYERELATPALLLDLDAFEANLKAMADVVARHGRKLRPHVKAHKSTQHRAPPARGGRDRPLLRHRARGGDDGGGRARRDPGDDAGHRAGHDPSARRGAGEDRRPRHRGRQRGRHRCARRSRLARTADRRAGRDRHGADADGRDRSRDRGAARAEKPPACRTSAIAACRPITATCSTFRRSPTASRRSGRNGRGCRHSSTRCGPPAWRPRSFPAAAPGRTSSTSSRGRSRKCRPAPTCSWTSSTARSSWRRGAPRSAPR